MPQYQRKALIKRSSAFACVILATFLWSFGGLLVKWVFWHPLAIAGMRSAISAVLAETKGQLPSRVSNTRQRTYRADRPPFYVRGPTFPYGLERFDSSWSASTWASIFFIYNRDQVCDGPRRDTCLYDRACS